MQSLNNDRSIPFGLSLPKSLLNIIDRERGDVTRSRFILRLLEKRVYPEKDSHPASESKNKKIEKYDKHKLDSSIENEYPEKNAVKRSVTIEEIERPVDHSFEAKDQLGSTIIKGDNRK